MEAVAPLAVAFVAAALLTWRHQRRDRRRERGEQIMRNFEADAQAVLAVAWREASARGAPAPGPAALLWGLLQNEAFEAALVRVGGVPAETEGRVLAALERDAAQGQVGTVLVTRASLLAEQHGRAATCTDLWMLLSGMPAAEMVSPASPYALAFLLVHGCEEPPATYADRDVHVVLRNDDYTSFQFVVDVLREAFDLSEADATALMMQVHQQGKGIIGRYPRDDARARVEAARARARTAKFPLWVGVEPC